MASLFLGKDMTDSTDNEVIIGTLKDAAKALYDELLTSGSSLLLEDVLKVFMKSTEHYVTWSGKKLLNKINDADPEPTSILDLSSVKSSTLISRTDWSIMETLVRAHCDLVQAKRIEGMQGLGLNTTAMSSSEARGYYDEALKEMKKEAFQCEPYTVDTPQSDIGIFTGRRSNGLFGACQSAPIKGEKGDSAYDLAVQNGFVGTVQDWLTYLENQGAQAQVLVSKLQNNIITKESDGLFADVDKPDDTLSFIDALDGAIK